MTQKTFIETGSKGYVKDTLMIESDKSNTITLRSSAMNGKCLIFSKPKIQTLAKYLMEIAK